MPKHSSGSSPKNELLDSIAIPSELKVLNKTIQNINERFDHDNALLDTVIESRKKNKEQFVGFLKKNRHLQQS